MTVAPASPAGSSRCPLCRAPLIAGICPNCDELLVYVSDPRFHVVAEPKASYSAGYEQNGFGHALIPFAASDGRRLSLRCFLRYHDPVSCQTYDYWPVTKILYRDALLHLTGLSESVFNEISANLPGRVAWLHEVACHTDEFMRVYFSNCAASQRWRKRPFRKAARQTAHERALCTTPGCKKRHR